MDDELTFFVIKGDYEQQLPLGDGKTQSGTHCIIREDEYVSFLLRSPKKLISPLLSLQDDGLKPYYEDQMPMGYEYHWKSSKPFFRNYFGTCQIVVELDQLSSRTRLLYTEVEVVATKLNAERANHLLNYLESKLPDIVRSCFSRTHHRIGDGTTSSVDAQILLQKVKQQIEMLTEKLPLFRNKKRCRLVPKPVLVDATAANSLSENSVTWVLSHLDLLAPSMMPSTSSINIHNKLYDIQNVQADVLHEDTDVYENRVILGYLEDVEARLSQVEDLFRKALAEVETDLVVQEIPDGYVSMADIRKRYGRKYFYRLIDICAEVQEACQQCKRFWQKNLSVKRSFRGMPEMTPGFLSYAHYRSVFELIVEWYRIGNVNLSGERYLLGLRNLPKLYEFFCLYRIIHSLESKGMTITEVSRRDQSETFEKNILPDDCYTLASPNGLHLKLYYTPDIRTEAHSEDDWVDVVHKGTRENSQYSPDFFVEFISSTGKKMCIILDAKYTSQKQAMRTLGEDYDYADELTKLTMKYIHGINLKRGGITPVSALFILHPKDFSVQYPAKFRSFHSDGYGIFSQSPVLPALGAIEVTPDENLDGDMANQNHELARVLHQTLKILSVV
jgi:hypothetical protein